MNHIVIKLELVPFICNFFAPESDVGFPFYTQRLSSITQLSCSASGSLWKMLDSIPGLLAQQSGARYQ